MKRLLFLVTCMVYAVGIVQAQDVQRSARDESEHGATQASETEKPRALSMKLGVTFGAIGASTVLPLASLFKPSTATDPNKLLASAIGKDAHTNVLLDSEAFLKFTLQGVHTIGISAAADGKVRVDESKKLAELFDKVDKGQKDPSTLVELTPMLNKETKVELLAEIRSFFDIGLMYQFKQPAYDVSARLAYFVPLAYMDAPYATITPTGGIMSGVHVHAEGEVAAYGSAAAAAAGSKSSMLKGGGVDVSVASSYVVADWATVKGGVKHIPIVPSKSSTGLSQKFTLDSDINMSSGGAGASDFAKDFKRGERSSSVVTKKIMRLCKLHVGADFRPLRNDLLILSPYFAFPAASNLKPYYFDGALKVESRFAKILGAYFETGRLDRIWRHEVGLLLDSRWCTAKVAVALAGNTLKGSFTGRGIGFKAGLSVGF